MTSETRLTCDNLFFDIVDLSVTDCVRDTTDYLPEQETLLKVNHVRFYMLLEELLSTTELVTSANGMFVSNNVKQRNRYYIFCVHEWTQFIQSSMY